MNKVLLLPGMDGTGLLFKALIPHLKYLHMTQTVILNHSPASDFSEHAKLLALESGLSKVFIIAESYSGRITYEACRLLGDKVAGLIFIASFISPPSTISRSAFLIPKFLLRPNQLTAWLIKHLCLTNNQFPEIVSTILNAIGIAGASRLKQRLCNIAKLDIPSDQYQVPTTYIQPSQDQLVTKDAIEQIVKNFPNTKIIKISGGHFIAQDNPTACAEIINKEVELALSVERRN